MDKQKKRVSLMIPVNLLRQVDEKIKKEQIYSTRTDLILALLRKYLTMEGITWNE